MERLLNAITELVANSSREKISQLADQIKRLHDLSNTSNLESWAMTSAAKARLTELLECWSPSDIPSNQLSGMLIGASHAYHHAASETNIELVWTGPSSELVATRKTEQALLQVINAAQKRLFITSFVAYDIPPIITALKTSLANGVEISMLLELSDQHGGGVSIDGIGLMKQALPTAKVYCWDNKPAVLYGGKVHAKVAVADEAICFISSANLTSHAMEKNMEAGVLIRGGAIPLKLHHHLAALVTTRVIVRV